MHDCTPGRYRRRQVRQAERKGLQDKRQMGGPVLYIHFPETTDILNIKPRYLVDGDGRKTGAVLSMKDYHALMQRLEDPEDTLELDRVVE